ncbi:MAG: hypothetical protein ACYDEB_06210 [Dehalococcoidia bacterium]
MGGGVAPPDVAGASFPRPAMKIGTNARLEFAADGLRSRFTASTIAGSSGADEAAAPL